MAQRGMQPRPSGTPEPATAEVPPILMLELEHAIRGGISQHPISARCLSEAAEQQATRTERERGPSARGVRRRLIAVAVRTAST